MNPTRFVEPCRTFISAEDAAALLGITAYQMMRLLRRRELPYRGSPRDPMVPLAEIKRLLDQAVATAIGDKPATRSLRNMREVDDSQIIPGHIREDIEQAFQPDRVVVGNVLEVVTRMPPSCVQAVVTSPPFWGQRVYDDETPVRWRDGTEVAFGREPSPEAYVDHTLEILGQLARVVKPCGTVWWNLGDTYMTRTIMRVSSKDRVDHYGGERTTWAGNPNRRASAGHPYLKDKDLALIPFHVAAGAQRIGYWVRSIIVWSKQRAADDWHDLSPDIGEVVRANGRTDRAHVPEIVADRPVTGHEYILLLAREPYYEYHAGAASADGATNVRSVWTFPPATTHANHGARFPDELPRRCILLGSREGDLIFDPFAGYGTTLRVARELGRQFFGCDTSPTYVELARRESERERPAQPPLFPSGAGGTTR